jgi:hypothetical protein
MELNPNHPVTQEVREQWHKIAAIMMNKLGITDLEITEADIEALNSNPRAIVADARNNEFHIRLLPLKEAEAIARKEARTGGGRH